MTPSEWIDEKIREEEISFFRYDEFMNLEKVGEGELGIVNRADWESGKIKIALKAFTNKYALNELDNENKKNDMERLIKELKILRRVGFHPNINQFYGITKEPESNNYVMVLQYANQGNLGKYLKNNFKSLLWSDKIRMASEIACGLKYLHSTKIIHRNLHAKNILVHNGILMIADLGLAKVLTVESSSNSVVNRISAYVEPQCYKYDNYVRDERSDIYSLGVLLWEITSGYPPFSKNSTHKDTSLTFKIINGHREKPIINTPKAYVNLYQRCWDEDPNLRPTVNEVFVILEELYKTIPKIMEDVIENNSDKNKQTLNNNQNNLKLSYLENPLSESPSFFTPNINNDEIKHINDATDEIIDSYLKRNRIGWTKNFSFPKVLEEHESKSEKIFGNLINNQTIRQYEVMVGYFYENGFGVGKNEIVAFEWYKKASEMNNINGHFELGYCYNYGYSIKRSLKEAIRLYKFSSDEGLNVATYFLANNYEFDNQKNNFNEAFKLYKKSAENGFIPSQYKLATFYEEGKGTQQNKKEALKWYKRFLENGGEHSETYNIKDNKLEKSLPIELIVDGIEKELIRNKLDEIIQAYLKRNKIGQTGIFSFSEVLKNYESKSREIFKCLYHNQTIRHYEVMMGKFYEKGFGTDKNNDKAIEWYMEAIKQNDINGIFEAGNCYYNGYGVEKNRNKAFEFIQRVVNDNTEELNIALYYLASCYNSGDGVRKKNETNQQLLREHQVKAFKLYKKSAENGFVQSQYELAECYKNGIGTQKNKDEASKWVEKYKESYGEDSFSYDHKRLKNDEIFRVSYDIEKIEKEKEQERQNVEIQKQEEFLTPTLVLAKINFDSQNITQEILTRKSTSLPQISGITKIMIKDIKLNEQLKLNHGLFLDGHNVLASKKAIFAEGGELNISTYNGQPLVYTIVNLEQSDLYINFPIAEIIYRGDLITTFSRCTDCNENLHKFYGHVFARKVLIGDKLFIKNFNSATSAEIDILKFCLVCAYNSAIHSKRIPFNNLFTLDLLPKIVSSNDEELSTYEKLIEWMNDLYITGEKSGLIVSYDDLVPVSQLRETSSLDEFFNENQLENVQFKKLGLEEWVGDAMNDNLTSWTGDFRLFQGLIFNKNYEIKISKKIAINFIEIPEVKTSDKSYLKIINPSTKLEVVLNSNNIFSLKNLDFFNIDNTKSYRGYTHVLIKCEQYEILFNKENVKPTEEFERVIEEALNNMKPLKALRDIFNEYGHLFPQRIILGRSLKNILSPSISSDTIDIRPESLISHLDKLNISYFITPKGNIIENDNLINWIQNPNNLEIIEFDKVDPLYKILKKEQQRKISDLLQNNYKILMTGITDLRDLDDNDIKYYKRINIEPSLEDEDYEVFGSIISNSNPRVEGIYVNFGSYDFNGFFAMIKKLEKTSVIIKECYILWMIVEKPSESLIFSPSNRDFQVNCIKRSITLQPSITNYLIKTSFKLSQGYTIFVHAYYPITNYEPDNIIRLIGWSDNLFIFQITKSNNETIINEAISMQLHICVLCSDYKNLKIDNKNNEEYSLNLIGHILTLENFSETCEAD